MTDAYFWNWLGKRFAEVGENISVRRSEGQLYFAGPADAIARFKHLAGLGARRKGFCGDSEGAVNYWVNLLSGHIANKRREL